MNYKITWRNWIGAQIAEAHASNSEDAAKQLIEMVRQCLSVEHGDTFTISTDQDQD